MYFSNNRQERYNSFFDCIQYTQKVKWKQMEDMNSDSNSLEMKTVICEMKSSLSGIFMADYQLQKKTLVTLKTSQQKVFKIKQGEK